MLVLSRKASESIHIGDDITVEVRRVAGNRVTLAIQAPRDIRILRGELEKVAKEFELPLPADAGPEVDSAETFVVSQDVLPANDFSDHGMSAYVV